jgi:hypothetical protein
MAFACNEVIGASGGNLKRGEQRRFGVEGYSKGRRHMMKCLRNGSGDLDGAGFFTAFRMTP